MYTFMRVVKGFSVAHELAIIFSVKREIKNFTHVNRDQRLFRDLCCKEKYKQPVKIRSIRAVFGLYLVPRKY